MFEIFEVTVNPLALIAATIINIVVGSFFFSPMFFGKMWRELVGRKESDMHMSSSEMILAILNAFVLSIGLNSILQLSLKATGLNEWMNVLVATLMTVFTICATTMFHEVVWEGRRKKLFLLNLTHRFFEILAMYVVLNLFL